MSTIINHPGWDEDPWKIELHEAPVIGRDGYQYIDATPVKTADEKPLRDDFGWGLVEGIADLFEVVAEGVGAALSGAANIAGGAFTAVLDGVNNFIGGIADAILLVFGGPNSGSEPTLQPIFSPIKTNLEAMLKPHFDEIEQSTQSIKEIRGEISEIDTKLDNELQAQTETSGKIQDNLDKLEEKLGDPANPAEGTFSQLVKSLEDKQAQDYQDLNTRLWGDQGEINQLNRSFQEGQMQWNATQEEVNDQLREIQRLQGELQIEQQNISELNSKMLKDQQPFIVRHMFVAGSSGGAVDDYFRITRSGDRWRVEALGDWVGRYTYQGGWWYGDSWSPNYQFTEVPDLTLAEPRVQYYDHANHSSIIQYWVDQAVHREMYATPKSYISGASRWTNVYPQPIVVPVTNNDFALYFEFTWDAATRHDNYGVRILLNGVQFREWSMTGLGPLFPWESGVRTRSISLYNMSFKEGDELTFQTYSTGTQPSQRSVSNVYYTLTWMESQTDGNVS